MLLEAQSVKTTLVALLIATAALTTACGAKPWHPGHHSREGRLGRCGQALSPDRSKELWVCYRDGLYECYNSRPGGYDNTGPLPFDSDCKAARKTLKKYDYVP